MSDSCHYYYDYYSFCFDFDRSSYSLVIASAWWYDLKLEFNLYDMYNVITKCRVWAPSPLPKGNDHDYFQLYNFIFNIDI